MASTPIAAQTQSDERRSSVSRTPLTDVPTLPLRGQECLTLERLDGTWTPVTCHLTRYSPIPDGRFRQIVHTHPGGSSLSLADLQMLARTEQIVAITPTRRYLARRGPAYPQLDTVYADVWDGVLREWRDARRGAEFGPAIHRINERLGALGVIVYVVEEK